MAVIPNLVQNMKFRNILFSISGSGYGQTTSSFLFSLRNKNNLPPFKIHVQYIGNAIYRKSNYGPTFGSGHDLHICDNPHMSCSSYSQVAYSFALPKQYGGQNYYFAGSLYFTPTEIEVFY